MIALVRRHCFLLAAAVLIWQGWAAGTASSATPGPAAGDPVPPPPPVFTAEDLDRRASDALALAPADPFLLRELLARRAAAEQDPPADAAAGTGVDAQPEQQSLTPSIRLTLQSTLPDGARGRAWINGQDLAVGDPIPGIVSDHPPILKSVTGSSVTITWAGRDYLLDLYSAAAIELPGREEGAE
jgi:hypothetical protein